MPIYRNPFQARFPAATKTIAAIFCAAALTACTGGGNEAAEAPGSSAPEANDQATTETAQVANRNLDFFAERYLAADERLKRRQDRIKSTLSN